ncbi:MULTISPECIES: hypothetical protein [Eubacterium]|uniref:Uncharacterized protein n=1 Tax=Eubacterium barkeri TaxID=1528 RepID=A0A1H3FCY9_EUBBA|nr:hypothetical protein [Eubacterium barkeri]SDX88790.1 hypothetical protein SAMN04488579_1107 [Eubacterium barkeri]
MPRPKGSRNRGTRVTVKVKAGASIAEQLAQVGVELEKQEALMAALGADVDKLAASLKEKKAAYRIAGRTVAKLTKEKEALAEQEAEAARVAEVEKLAEAMLSSGKSTDEIMAFLNQA